MKQSSENTPLSNDRFTILVRIGINECIWSFNICVGMKMNTSETSGMKQWINFPTHKQGNTLHLIITELAAEVQIKNIYCGPYISDHCIITHTCNIPKTKMVTKQIKYRDFKIVNMI